MVNSLNIALGSRANKLALVFKTIKRRRQERRAGGTERNYHPDGGSLAGLRLDHELAIDQPHALLHAQQTEPSLALGEIHRIGCERSSVIRDLHADAVFESA